ncbi:lysoplasmalogenase [Parvularcula sp. IMCC14364]|uniref:lysoplasmalogenase n=1 Tax=Parvularcula sp. IMCC14364 TaxID=3067902 RepID=UPI002742442C|nr:lysoplasmalogenase [Parvularcula sp. IMCC14364]
MKNTADILLYCGVAVAATYLVTEFIAVPFPAVAIWKAAGIILFGLYALWNGARIAATGLLFSAAGDIALALPEPNFIAGMAFFGTAHILYTLAFWHLIRQQGRDPQGLPVLPGLLAYSVLALVWFLPGMGDLLIPGLAYQAIITLMVVTSFFSNAPLSAKIGAVLFMLSDTLIAFGLYRDMTAPPGSIWLTYAAAQFLLALGLVQARNQPVAP